MKMPSRKAPRTFDREGHNARYWTPIPGGIAERAVNAMRRHRHPEARAGSLSVPPQADARAGVPHKQHRI
jgi:hypothetical protein